VYSIRGSSEAADAKTRTIVVAESNQALVDRLTEQILKWLQPLPRVLRRVSAAHRDAISRQRA
jgi:hypothetical protein